MQRWLSVSLLLFGLSLWLLLMHFNLPVKDVVAQQPVRIEATRRNIPPDDVYQAGKKPEFIAAPLSSDFTVLASLEGLIGYFNGRTNAGGRQLTRDKNRFLAGEGLRLILDFSSDPAEIDVNFCGQQWHFTGRAGITHYETTLLVPAGHQTLDWSDQRQEATQSIKITATARQDSTKTSTISLGGIEVTGRVEEIVHVQPIANGA